MVAWAESPDSDNALMTSRFIAAITPGVIFNERWEAVLSLEVSIQSNHCHVKTKKFCTQIKEIHINCWLNKFRSLKDMTKYFLCQIISGQIISFHEMLV